MKWLLRLLLALVLIVGVGYGYLYFSGEDPIEFADQQIDRLRDERRHVEVPLGRIEVLALGRDPDASDREGGDKRNADPGFPRRDAFA